MKKLLSILILSLLCVCCMVGFTACNGVEFKINFIVDGEVYAIVNTNGTETVKMPDNPTKDDYTFNGWFWDNDVWEKPFTANSLLDAPLSSDMSVYAKFKSNHTHNYIETVTKEPTCTEKGEKTYTCECGDSYTEEMNALGHDFGAWTTIKAPTCTETGVEIRYCLRDNAHFETRNIEALGHDFGAWIETLAPTCTTKGVETRYCSHNNTHTETREINELGHEFTNYVSDGNATYYSDGTKTSVCERGCGATNTVTDTGSKLPEITEYFEKKQDGSYYGKVYNTTTVFDFNGKINYDGEYYVCTDLNCTLPLTDYKTSLNLGDNVFYVLFDNGQKTTATVHRRLNYTVNFETGGGTNVAPQTIEEDRHLVAPNKNPMRVGYTFSEWNYDFNEPITDNTTITAIWNANTNTPYRIEYYLQNLEDDEYTLQENDTEYLTGTTDTIITATKTYDHFTVIDDTASANISPDGSLVLKVYYTRNLYTVNISAGENIMLSEYYNGQFKYGYIIPQTTVTINLGYDLIWYNDIEFLTNNLTIPSFTVNKNVNYLVTCALKHEMTNFNFTSTATTCTITGIKDKTVTEIIVPDYVTVINEGVFSGCTNLESITIPFVGNSKKTAIETYQYPLGYIFGTSSYTGGRATTQHYHGNSSSFTTYKTYYIPSSLKNVTVTGGEILYGAFDNCDSLKSVAIVNGITSIGDMAFSGCNALSNMMIGENVTIIDDGAFGFGGRLLNITVNEKNKTYKSIDGNLFNKDETIIIKYASGKTETDYTLPDSVTSIGNCAFYNCSSLTGIMIPNSVTSIGSNGFSGCSTLTSIYYIGTASEWASIDGLGALMATNRTLYVNNEPVQDIVLENITEIKPYAFAYCSGLTEITIPNSVTIIGYDAFKDCSSLTSITIPNSVTSIGSFAFSGCSGLTSVTIGNSVTSIGNFAFYNCSGLTSITIPDSVTSIGDSAFYDCKKLKNATFINPNGWELTQLANGKIYTYSISSDNLSQTSTAANYLKLSDYYWYRK